MEGGGGDYDGVLKENSVVRGWGGESIIYEGNYKNRKYTFILIYKIDFIN